MSHKHDGRDRGPEFHCASLNEALPHLRRPPAPGAVQFKIQNTADQAAQVAAYVDARMVFDRLDQVCGRRWFAEFEPLPERLIPPPVDRDGQVLARPPLYVRCRLTICGVTRQDVGEGADPKAAFSDAVKRAAVQFGIARALYALRAPWLGEGEGDGELRRNGRGRLILDARTERFCREQYERWLEKRGVRQFGEPLDHGDELGAGGFEADRAPQGAGVRHEVGQPGAASADESQRPAKPEPAEPRDADTAGQAGEADSSGRETVSAGLRAVTDGSPGPAPASAIERRAVEHWRTTGRYKPDTVEALAGLLCGEQVLERLDRDAVKHLALTLELAVRGKVAQRELAAEVTRLSKREQREQAATELRERLVLKANEAELTPPSRRKAA